MSDQMSDQEQNPYLVPGLDLQYEAWRVSPQVQQQWAEAIKITDLWAAMEVGPSHRLKLTRLARLCRWLGNRLIAWGYALGGDYW